MKVVRVLALLVLLAAAGAACSPAPATTPLPPTSTPAPPTATPAPPTAIRPARTATPQTAVAPEVVVTSTLASGWTAYELRTSGFAVSLPPQWVPLEFSPAGLQSMMGVFADLNPAYQEIVSSETLMTLVSKGVKFYAFDLSPQAMAASFPVSLNVLKVDVGLALPLDYVVNANLEQVKSLADPAVPVTHRRVDLSGLAAEELNYGVSYQTAVKGEVLTRFTQLLAVDGTNMYAFSMIAPDELAAAYAPIFEKIGQSLHLLK